MAGIDPSVWQDAGALIIVDGDRAAAYEALRAGGAVLVPEAVADRAGFALDDRIQVAVPGGSTAEMTVAGVVAYSPARPVRRRRSADQPHGRADNVRRRPGRAVGHGPAATDRG